MSATPRRGRPAADLYIPPECRDMIRRGALVSVSSSAGKDSQAMTILLARIVPRDQLLVVHAPLGEVEWPGTVEHIENTMPAGVPLIFARVASGKTLLDQVEERGKWPGPRTRFCTRSQKISPIERELRHYLKAHPRFGGRIVSAIGIRRDESSARSKRIPWARSDRNSRAGREWFDWMPIFDLTAQDVFRVIRETGQSPHWVYGQGVSRCSCSFCIFSSRSDLRRAAELRPDLYEAYSRLEKRIGHTLSPSGAPLPALTGFPVDSNAGTPGLSERLRPTAAPAHEPPVPAPTPSGGGARSEARRPAKAGESCFAHNPLHGGTT